MIEHKKIHLLCIVHFFSKTISILVITDLCMQRTTMLQCLVIPPPPFSTHDEGSRIVHAKNNATVFSPPTPPYFQHTMKEAE